MKNIFFILQKKVEEIQKEKKYLKISKKFITLLFKLRL